MKKSLMMGVPSILIKMNDFLNYHLLGDCDKCRPNRTKLWQKIHISEKTIFDFDH